MNRGEKKRLLSLMFSLPTIPWGINVFFCHSVDTQANLHYKNVLDLCFKMNLGFCLYSGMVRPTDQEMTVTEKTVSPTVPKRRKQATSCRAAREALGSVRRQKE